jgi:hypothetical protein
LHQPTDKTGRQLAAGGGREQIIFVLSNASLLNQKYVFIVIIE